MEGMPQFKDLALREVAALQYQKGRRLETELKEKLARKQQEKEEELRLRAAQLAWEFESSQRRATIVQTFQASNEATATGAALPAAPPLPSQLLGESSPFAAPLPIGTSSQTQFAKTSGGSPFKGVEKEKQPASAPAAHEAPTATASQLQVACIHPGRRAWLDECPEITIKVTRRELPPYPARDESWEDAQMWTCLECKECSAIWSHTADESRKMARCTKFRNKTCAWAQFFSYP